MARLPSSRCVASRYVEAALFEPPPEMLAAARYFFVSRWGSGVLEEVQRKQRSQKARLRKVRKMLKEQEASVEAAVKAEKEGRSFDLLIYHAPANPRKNYNQIRKRVVRYTLVRDAEDPWDRLWEVDRPFKVEDTVFDGDWLNISGKMEDAGYFGPNYLVEMVDKIERTLASLDDFKREVIQAMNSRKSNADLLSKGASFNEALCKMDLAGWKLWERRVPDEAERARLEAVVESRITLKMRFDPQDTGSRDDPDGGFAAYWNPNKWMVVFAGMSGYWSVESLIDRSGDVDTVQFRSSVRELDRVVIHEMKHYAQSMLKKLLSLPEIAGQPGLTDPSVADAHGSPVGEHWQKWDPHKGQYVDQRIPHEIRDVEFETRVGDEVARFVNGWEDIEKQMLRGGTAWPDRGPVPEGEWSRIYLNMFLGRDSGKSRADQAARLWFSSNARGLFGKAREAFAPSRWFSYLRKNDRKRYQTAVAKFTAELSRLGYMARMDRGGRLPLSTPNHPAWGLPISEHLPWDLDPATRVRALREYDRFVDSLDIDQLRRHRALVRERGSYEYWLTPRWQDYIEEPLSNEELEARRTEAQRIEHPRIKRSPRRASSRRVAFRHSAGKTYFHGTRLDDALSIEKGGYRINRAGRRGAIFGPGFYMTADRSFAEGYAKDVLYDEGLDAAILHLKITPRKPLPLDPKDWPDEVRDLYVRWNGDVPAQKNRVDWWDVGTIARKFGHDAVVDGGGDYAVVFDPSVVQVVKVEPMTRDS